MIKVIADRQTKAVFQKTIDLMKMNVVWNGTFVVNNNTIILPGTQKSIIFSFENRKVIGTIIDLKGISDEIRPMMDNRLLDNTLNILLYIFGKWGQIKGLVVEKDYRQLKQMIDNVLGEIKVTCEFSGDKCIFLRDNIKISYEEVVEAAFQLLGEEEQEPEDNEQEGAGESEETDKSTEETSQAEDIEGMELSARKERRAGLWHKLIWKSLDTTFTKERVDEAERNQYRLGKNFYLSNYKCPICGQFLFMVIFPEQTEFKIETDEGGVFLARAYTCSKCNSLYTPRPGQLLMEGNEYTYSFEEDRQAYEDYIELLGNSGARTSNANYNRYAQRTAFSTDTQQEDSSVNASQSGTGGTGGTGRNASQSGAGADGSTGAAQTETGRTVSWSGADGSTGAAQTETGRNASQSGTARNASQSGAGADGSTGAAQTETGRNASQSGTARNASQSDAGADGSTGSRTGAVRQPAKSAPDMDQLMKNIASQTDRDVIDMKDRLDSGFYAEAVVEKHLKKLDKELAKRGITYANSNARRGKTTDAREAAQSTGARKAEVSPLVQRAVKAAQTLMARGDRQGFQKLAEAMSAGQLQEFQKNLPQETADEYRSVVRQKLAEKQQRELAAIVQKIPANITKQQYQAFRAKIEEYNDTDHTEALQQLQEKRDLVERNEISNYIAGSKIKPGSRSAVLAVYQKLKEQDFEERNKKPFLESLYEQVRDLDCRAISRICPDEAQLGFTEGTKAYEKIEQGDFLPELKEDVLGRIDRRLQKLKRDECEQLVKKLRKKIGWNETAFPEVHLYDVRSMSKEDNQEDAAVIVRNAVHTYGMGHGRYEYPLMVCDCSRSGNGTKGFILTPDRLFYDYRGDSGFLSVAELGKLYTESGFLSKGIYVQYKGSGYRISAPLKLEKTNKVQYQTFIDQLNGFISYLKEKPESREVSYLVKSKHDTKCCYRCGFVYKTGNICPKCGWDSTNEL